MQGLRKQRKIGLPLPDPEYFGQVSDYFLETVVMLRPGNPGYKFDPSSVPQGMQKPECVQ